MAQNFQCSGRHRTFSVVEGQWHRTFSVVEGQWHSTFSVVEGQWHRTFGVVEGQWHRVRVLPVESPVEHTEQCHPMGDR